MSTKMRPFERVSRSKPGVFEINRPERPTEDDQPEPSDEKAKVEEPPREPDTLPGPTNVPKRRGRPPGSKNKPKAPTAP